jgi:PIN domain nuclease of toxin-antitoxin system
MKLHHRDPFDRILIAQSLEESLPIVTADPQFQKYPSDSETFLDKQEIAFLRK